MKYIPIYIVSISITILILSTISVFSFQIPEDIRENLEERSVYTEGDGLTKWEKFTDGTIVKYHIGSKKINWRIEPSGKTTNYEKNGIVKFIRENGIETFYDDKSNVINIVDTNTKTIKIIEDGKVRRVEKEGVQNISSSHINIDIDDKTIDIFLNKDGTINYAKQKTILSNDYIIKEDEIYVTSVKNDKKRHTLSLINIIVRIFSNPVPFSDIESRYEDLYGI